MLQQKSYHLNNSVFLVILIVEEDSYTCIFR